MTIQKIERYTHNKYIYKLGIIYIHKGLFFGEQWLIRVHLRCKRHTYVLDNNSLYSIYKRLCAR